MSLPARACVRGKLYQPRSESFRLPKARQVPQDRETNGLKNIGSIIPRETSLDWNRKDEVRVFVNKHRPSLLIAQQTFLNQYLVLRESFTGIEMPAGRRH